MKRNNKELEGDTYKEKEDAQVLNLGDLLIRVRRELKGREKKTE